MLQKWFETMLFIRMVDEQLAQRYEQNLMRCPVHLSIGQEAVAVGVCSALERDDKMLTSHRCHAHYLAKGGNLYAMIAEIHNKATGCCGGRAGSMYLRDHQAGLMLSVPIVGGCIGLAVGVALAMKQKKLPTITVVFFGDAAIEEGIFHEVANFAALHKLPILFACENNMLSVYTHLNERQPSATLTRFAQAHHIPFSRVDGNDVTKVFEETSAMVNNIRKGEGPGFIQFDTYRYVEHCGPNQDDHLHYRPQDELHYWREKCPVEHAKNILFKQHNLQNIH